MSVTPLMPALEGVSGAFPAYGRPWHDGCFARHVDLSLSQRLLNELVLRRLPDLVDRAEQRGGFIASHVVRYLDRFGTCGDLGFALLRCECGLAKVVPFSCKGRALCPTCGGRAMSSGAAHLVDHVLPEVAVCQWVLS